MIWNISNLQRKTAVDVQKRRVSLRTLQKLRLKVESAGVKVENAGVGNVGVRSLSGGLASSKQPKVQKKQIKKAILKRNTTVSIKL